MSWRDKHARAQSFRDRKPGSKYKARKGKFLKGPAGYLGGGKANRTIANRLARHRIKQELR